MKRLFILFIFPIIFYSCSSDQLVGPANKAESGSLLFKIDRTSAPENISTVSLSLSRNGYENIYADMNLLSDSTAEIQLSSIPVGTWHLLVEAKNSSHIVEYTGETDVTIVENNIIQLNLTLYPVSNGTGGIQITVNWANRSWVDYPNNPILVSLNNPSSPFEVRHAKVLYDNGIYKMWYSAGYSDAQGNIWYAESQDGISWTTIGNQPVLNVGPLGSWDSHVVVIDAVIKENNQYKMYYSGNYAHPSYGTWRIGLAVSNDGIHWEKNINPVLNNSVNYNSLGSADVLKKDNTYYMYFDYNDSSYNRSKIGLATSSDGINWQISNSNPVLSANLSWEYGNVSYPSVIYEEGNFKMVYSNGSVQDALGMAESADGRNFVKDASPILKNTDTNHGWVRIAYPQFRKLNNQYRIYYSGEEYARTSICLATKN